MLVVTMLINPTTRMQIGCTSQKSDLFSSFQSCEKIDNGSCAILSKAVLILAVVHFIPAHLHPPELTHLHPPKRHISSAVKTVAAWRQCREESYQKVRKGIENVCFSSFFLTSFLIFPHSFPHFFA